LCKPCPLTNTTSIYELINDETNSRLNITDSGDYRLEVTAENDNVLMDEITVEFEGDFGLGTPNDLFIDEGDMDGFAIFDLTVNNTVIIDGESPADFVISYYETLQDAEADTNAIAMPMSYQNIVNPQIVYVRTASLVTDCRAISSFVLETDVLSVANEEASLFTLFPNPTSDIVNIRLSNPNATATVAIIDIQGKIIKEENIQTSQNINVQDLSQGLYFIQVRSENNVSTLRLIKK
jgi:hypothetical protein